MHTIVYVEDDLNSQKVMRGLMETLRFPTQLHILFDSKDFLTQVERISPEPDLFLLDIHVAPYNGFEMLRQLRGHNRFHDKMVVALTASVMNQEVKELKLAGFDGVLAKPLKFSEFAGNLKQILEGQQLWVVKR